ncbi:MAG: hypothetical protein JWN30_2390, partial [Bacilli bacterium]|nr:hypothetical protein [Bacilli bacterium]
MTQGKLLLIGGAEGKQGEREILSTFVKLAGGAQAQIYVI